MVKKEDRKTQEGQGSIFKQMKGKGSQKQGGTMALIKPTWQQGPWNAKTHVVPARCPSAQHRVVTEQRGGGRPRTLHRPK